MDKLFIERKAILALDNGAKIEAVVTMPSPRKAMFHERWKKSLLRTLIRRNHMLCIN